MFIAAGWLAFTIMGALFYLKVDGHIQETFGHPKFQLGRLFRQAIIMVFWGWAFGIIRTRPERAKEAVRNMIRRTTDELELTWEERMKLNDSPDLVVG